MSGIVGVILAGGEASRMGGRNKPLLAVAGRPMIEHIIANATTQVQKLIISVNRNLQDYRYLRLPLVPDLQAKRGGPLTGICSAMQWYHEQGEAAEYLACFPGDVPAFPADLVSILSQAVAATEPSCSTPAVAWCQTGDQIQPLFSLWPMACLPQLKDAISSGIHGPRLYFKQYPNLVVKLPPPRQPQFLNINTPGDLEVLEQLLASR